MPNHKNRSRNNKSQKSTASVANDDDFGFGNLLKITKPSSRKTTPKTVSPRPEFLEPLSPTPMPLVAPPPSPSPWECLGMAEQEYTEMIERVNQRAYEYDRECYWNNLEAQFNRPSYWTDRIEQLEREREYFNVKRGWSAAEIACVERIDAEITACEEEIQRIYAEEDRVEVEYD